VAQHSVWNGVRFSIATGLVGKPIADRDEKKLLRFRIVKLNSFHPSAPRDRRPLGQAAKALLPAKLKQRIGFARDCFLRTCLKGSDYLTNA
jgi:hypothetical protein